MDSRDELIDHYGYTAEIFATGYDIMGRLLDKRIVEKEVEKRQLSDLYIYGGGYLGIQLYQAITPFTNVLSVVDKSGKLKIDLEDIPIMDIDTFCSCYQGEPVIITPIQYYREIYHELQDIVADNKIIFLTEFEGL